MRALLVVAAALLVTASGAASVTKPATLARSVVVEWTTGSPERAWQTMHPAEQRIVTRAHFAYCVRVGRGQRLYPTRVKVLKVTPVKISRAEIPQRSGWSVRLLEMQRTGGSWERNPWRMQVVRTPHGLRWLLDKPSFEGYRRFGQSQDLCPE